LAGTGVKNLRKMPAFKKVRPLGRRRSPVDEPASELLRQEREELLAVQRELEVSRQQYADLFELAPVGYVTFDRAGCILNINETGARLLESEPAHLLGRPLLLMVTKGERRAYLNHLSRLRHGDPQAMAEITLRTRKGRELVVQLISMMSGSATQIRTALVDITERKAREQQMLEQAGLLELSFDAIFVRDMNDRITFWNKGAEETYGYTRDEALGKICHALLKTKFPEPLEKVRRKLLRDDRWTGEVKQQCRDRGRITVVSRWALDRDESGQPKAILESNTNITVRKRAEREVQNARELLEKHVAERTAELQLANQKLQALFDGSPLALFTLDRDGNTRSWNKSAEQMFGWTEQEVLGKPVPHVPEAQREEFEAVRMAGLQGKSITVETARRRKDGSIVEVRLSDAPVRNAQGEIVGTMGMLEDISERVRLEKALLDVSEEEKARLGRDLHDGLGQHLAGISFMAETLRNRLSVNARVEAELAAKIVGHIHQAINVSRDLAKGLFPVELKTQGFVPGLEKLASAISERFHIQCLVKGEGNIRVPNENVARNFYRLAQEAAYNAAKHSRGKTIRISVAQRNGETCLTVEDDGVGIPDEHKKSPGMGLRIMEYRARMLGAKLDVRRGRQGGTVVTCSAETKS
jgi:two-component system, LuxR family, sensor kinase FixL